MFERRIPFQKGYFSKLNEDDLKDSREDDNGKRKPFFLTFVSFCFLHLLSVPLNKHCLEEFVNI